MRASVSSASVFIVGKEVRFPEFCNSATQVEMYSSLFTSVGSSYWVLRTECMYACMSGYKTDI